MRDDLEQPINQAILLCANWWLEHPLVEGLLLQRKAEVWLISQMVMKKGKREESKGKEEKDAQSSASSSAIR
jgi:hypothetical protein